MTGEPKQIPQLECKGCQSRDEIIKNLAGEIDRLNAERTQQQQEIKQAA